MPLLIFSLTLIGLILFGVYYFFSAYKSCPANQVMIVQRKAGEPECYVGGSAFIWPNEEVGFLDLQPYSKELYLVQTPTRDGIKMDVEGLFVTAVSTHEEIVIQAARRLLGMSREAIQKLANDIILISIKKYIADSAAETICKQSLSEIEGALFPVIEKELNKIGLTLINAHLTQWRDEAGFRSAFIQSNEQALKLKAIELEKRNKE